MDVWLVWDSGGGCDCGLCFFNWNGSKTVVMVGQYVEQTKRYRGGSMQRVVSGINHIKTRRYSDINRCNNQSSP